MAKMTHSQALTKGAKLNLKISEAYKYLQSKGLAVPANFSTFQVLWDASQNKEGVSNFTKLGTLLEGYAVAMAEAVAVAEVTEAEAVAEAVGQ